jgi:hypothetical protein
MIDHLSIHASLPRISTSQGMLPRLKLHSLYHIPGKGCKNYAAKCQAQLPSLARFITAYSILDHTEMKTKYMLGQV